MNYMYLVGYDRSFKETCQTGWGCGYVMIPVTHPKVVEWEAQKTYDDYGDVDFYDKYLSLPDMIEEITYTEYKVVNDIKYVVIGFDTAHSYNSAEHDFNYVFEQTLKIKALFD